MANYLCKKRGERGFEILSSTFPKSGCSGQVLVSLWSSITDEKGGRD